MAFWCWFVAVSVCRQNSSFPVCLRSTSAFHLLISLFLCYQRRVLFLSFRAFHGDECVGGCRYYFWCDVLPVCHLPVERVNGQCIYI